MTDSERLAFLDRFFVVACAMDAVDSFFYSTGRFVFMEDDQIMPISIHANCNDLFEWACSDAVQVTPENIGVLEQAWSDVKPLRDAWWAAKGDKSVPYVSGSHAVELFACRVRKMRPQGPCYSLYPPSVAALLDAAGPERGARREYSPKDARPTPTPDSARPWTCPKCKPTEEAASANQ